MQYTTQMDAARKGIHTEALKIVAEKENYDIDKLCTLVAEGKVIIPCNKTIKGSFQTESVRC